MGEQSMRVVTAAALAGVSLYAISGSNARADVWGCKVVLCLSNPGGPARFAQCRPPIEKLWRELAEGHSFPTCGGVGLNASRPHYEPYFCDAGYRLTVRYEEHGTREAACTAIEPPPRGHCHDERGGSVSGLAGAPGIGAGCRSDPVVRPKVRSKPHYIDVTIEGHGKQRVWF